MKKSYLFIGVGVLFLFFGVFLYFRNGEKVMENLGTNLLTREEAISVISEKVNYLIKVYEDSSSVFDITSSDSSGKIINKVNNYSEIVESIFTENGINQFENTMFGKDKFVTKNDDGIFLLSELPSDNSYINSKIILNKVNVKENEIVGEITFSDSKLEEDALTYYVIVKEIKLVKVNDVWLVDSFLYSNE